MKVITNVFIPLVLLMAMIWGCEKSDQIIGETIYKGQSFLRFYLITNSNGEPIAQEDIQIGKTPEENYTHNSVKPLSIPVSLTHSGIDENVTADFTQVATGDFSGFTITPDVLSFSKKKLIDTINIAFSERWNPADSTKIDFELTGCSDNTVSLGHLNNFNKNNKLSITLGDIITTCTISSNRIEILGEVGEQVEFEVLFDNGFLPEEVEALDLFTEVKGFEYTLEKVIEEDNYESIKYIITLTEDIQNDDVQFITTIELNESVLFQPIGNSVIQIVKPLIIPRDNSVFTSSNFYNLNDPYYRIYGENWMWHSGDAKCKWKAWNAFGFPVEVPRTHPNAVWFSGQNTPNDTLDDVYHHAFQIGFNSREPERTTVNAFNLKRWFNNFTWSPQTSPGFNIPKALEFYPKDGVSETEGTVLVISQIISISNKGGKKYNISISGEGTYSEISPGLFEIILTFKAYNEELFGGTQVSYYRMYNSNSYGGDPDPLDVGCIEVVDL